MTDIESRLNNWARWGRPQTQYRRTYSLEGRYIPEAGDVFEEKKAVIPIDMRDAVILEKIIVQLPTKHRKVIVYSWVYPWTVKNDRLFYKVCRLCGVRPSLFERYENEAKNMVKKLLNKKLAQFNV